jgi:hypothetical protein
LEGGKLIAEYELHRFEVFQVHPTYGRRSLIKADGHGQLAWVGEVAGSLLILDQWNCMGYKDGSLRVLDPDTLESRATIELDFDVMGSIGFDDADHFVLSEARAGRTTWRAWRLTDWVPVEGIKPVDRGSLRGLKEMLTCMVDLPRVSPEAPQAGR